jgi:hypothetical protein
MEFFFCNDDIERCVKGTKRKWIQSRPDIPSIWPVKIGTNLSKKEILDFESVGFQLPQRAVISPRRLFGTEELPFNLASFPTLASADDCPKTRSGKSIRKNKNAPSTKQANNCASALTFVGTRILIFFALDPKIVPKSRNLRFGNSKIRETD